MKLWHRTGLLCYPRVGYIRPSRGGTASTEDWPKKCCSVLQGSLFHLGEEYMRCHKNKVLGVRALNPYEIGGVALLAVCIYFGMRLLPEIRRYIKISRM